MFESVGEQGGHGGVEEVDGGDRPRSSQDDGSTGGLFHGSSLRFGFGVFRPVSRLSALPLQESQDVVRSDRRSLTIDALNSTGGLHFTFPSKSTLGVTTFPVKRVRLDMTFSVT
jgi:hypothetical protein